ncbi:MAG: alpha/beta hydrolase [Candidatus Manganitrophus sp.]|nr:MAG: alpha/beta hydrolase [Candidatus Manganitrophus sp.]
MPTKTIALIHGNFVTQHCWDEWAARYKARGYKTVQIAYPGRDKPVELLKQNPSDPILQRLTIDEVIDHHVRVIRSLPEKPIIIGHSFGGLLTQLMLQRDLGVAGVAIDSVPPQGVLVLKWSFLRSLWPVINPLIPASKPYYMTFEDFQYTFTNTLPLDEQRAAYEAQVVPESRRLARGGLSSAARVDFKRARPPLLMIAGEKDHLMPAALNRANYERYKSSPSITEFKEFPGRDHYIIGERGWEEVADDALDWAIRAQARTAARAA